MARNSLGTPQGEGLRRSRSLRERAGVDDGRLERLPTALCATLSLPATQSNLLNPHKSRPVKKSEFAEHVRLMSAENEFQFSIEYDELRHTGRSHTSLAGEEKGNRERNRFNNVLPFDHSRVRLSTAPDYINANFVPGPCRDRDFIATQGPLPTTVQDFWTMLWDQDVECVVNLTRCTEKGKEKCHRYWPLRDPLNAVNYQVTLESEETAGLWVVRLLRVSKKGDERLKDVVQLHFSGWPDFGVPEHPGHLVDFVHEFRRRFPVTPVSSPVVVHCSAGIGRTGTFIALDRLLHSLPTSEVVDVFGLVHQMRQSRVSMVQTEQQYAFIHQCVQQELEPTEAPPPATMDAEEMDAVHSALHSMSLCADGAPAIRVDDSSDFFSFPTPPTIAIDS